MLVTFCAIGERRIKVINGNEKGTLLHEIHNYNTKQELAKLQPESVFLDNSTGDFYVFDPIDLEWKPKGNVGLYFKITIEIGRMPGHAYVQRPQQYVSRPDYVPKAPLQKVYDVNCRLFRHTCGHFIFKEVPKEFVVEARNHWNSHEVQTTNIAMVQR